MKSHLKNKTVYTRDVTILNIISNRSVQHPRFNTRSWFVVFRLNNIRVFYFSQNWLCMCVCLCVCVSVSSHAEMRKRLPAYIWKSNTRRASSLVMTCIDNLLSNKIQHYNLFLLHIISRVFKITSFCDLMWLLKWGRTYLYCNKGYAH